jgi:hypothetical protein
MHSLTWDDGVCRSKKVTGLFVAHPAVPTGSGITNQNAHKGTEYA